MIHITLRPIHPCADVPFALDRQPRERLPHSPEADEEVGAYWVLLRPLPRHRKRTHLLGPCVGALFKGGLPPHGNWCTHLSRGMVQLGRFCKAKVSLNLSISLSLSLSKFWSKWQPQSLNLSPSLSLAKLWSKWQEKDRFLLFRCKVDLSYLVTFLMRTPIFERYVVWCGFKNGLLERYTFRRDWTACS